MRTLARGARTAVVPYARSRAPFREPLPYLRHHVHGLGWLRFLRHWLATHLHRRQA